MTNILQPLDVAVNRRYQELYIDQYDEYLGKALKDPLLQTKAGNPKVPPYATVAQWTLDWVASKDSASIKRAFTLCGLVNKQEFDTDDLHPPLRELLAADVDMELWNQQYRNLAGTDDREQLDISAPRWYLPDNRVSSLFCCLLHGIGTPLNEYVAELTSYMETVRDLDGLFDAGYMAGI
ncbi:hypothetical protein PR002_g28358 [Phytophthora rubi]|uniref:Uncharacterized protein n=1 Tax=Phytophthora rubi TaxID=129364 RepID=A0A6A3HCW2_9STRA|nr:hypothetical protein PR002_g28358 [Phytophthora rubi]